jgi:uncharacterized protein with HEPN domain
MVPRSQLVRLNDILENIDAVADMIDGVDLGSYRKDFKLSRAVERCVEIISEAQCHIPATLKNDFPSSPGRRLPASGTC